MAENQAIVLIVKKSLDRAFVMGQMHYSDKTSASLSANARADIVNLEFKQMQAQICDTIQEHLNQLGVN